MIGKHTHEWKALMHLDACHRYEWRYECECGALLFTWAERDLEADPYSAVWMADEGEQRCDRCQELMAGAKPKHGEHVTEAAV